MTGSFHRIEFFDPFLDRKLAFVAVIFGEEVAVLTTEIATVRDVDGADRKPGYAKDEQFSDVTQFTELSTYAHVVDIMREVGA
jgi:hypothetical protein